MGEIHSKAQVVFDRLDQSEKRLDLAFADLDAWYVATGIRDSPEEEAKAVSRHAPRGRHYQRRDNGRG